jgi:deoxyribodipyrimidine photo-lyase
MMEFHNRLKIMNDRAVKDGDFVIYWMQSSQRTEFNHALEYSILKANKLNNPLVVFFGLTDSYPEANQRHYWFMLEGLQEVQNSLFERGITMLIRHTAPEIGAIELSKNASLIVVDRGYTKPERAWRQIVAKKIECPLIQVESNVVVPIEIASQKEEYSAATLRPKISKHIRDYLKPLTNKNLEKTKLRKEFDSLDISKIENVISKLDIDKSVKRVEKFHGGQSEAKKHLNEFIKAKLDNYREYKNDPTKHCVSNISPYLHFGNISPIQVALKILETENQNIDPFLEELIIRRELAINFVYFNYNYDSLNGLHEWQKKTLNEHAKDTREFTYTLTEFENAQTHDHYWNSAQKEMMIEGKMHGYMRMYWGKKIIEWTNTPEEAYKIALSLNNKYELDGRDPNGFAGVAWCFGKHDRPWKEREIFGKVRYMNSNGLKRKFDADAYVKIIDKLTH